MEKFSERPNVGAFLEGDGFKDLNDEVAKFLENRLSEIFEFRCHVFISANTLSILEYGYFKVKEDDNKIFKRYVQRLKDFFGLNVFYAEYTRDVSMGASKVLWFRVDFKITDAFIESMVGLMRIAKE